MHEKEIQINQITKDNIKDIKYENIKLFSFADMGAMGTHGEIVFACFDGKLQFYKVNWCYDSIYEEVAKTFFAPLDKSLKTCVFLNWENIYLGFGNHLFIRKEESDIFKRVAKKYDERIFEFENRAILYQNWKKIVQKIYVKKK